MSVSGATAPAGGADIAPGGSITYRPNPGYLGPDSFIIRVSDRANETFQRIPVNVGNTALTYVGDKIDLILSVSAPATDIKYLLRASDMDPGQTLSWALGVAPSHGVVTLAGAFAASGSTDITASGAITYTPTSGYCCSDSFSVLVTDGIETVSRTILVNINNAPPAFVEAVAAVELRVNDPPRDIRHLLHASDPNPGQTLTWSQEVAPLYGALSFSGATASSGGSDITPGGSILYVPVPNEYRSDSFTVRVSDGYSTATRTISVTFLNTAPTFVSDTPTMEMTVSAPAQNIKNRLRASDTNNGQTLTWSQQTAPNHGTLSFNGATASSGGTDITPGGTITYTPFPGYAGPDSFTVRLSDGRDFATRTIPVFVVNVAPTFLPVAPHLTVTANASATDIKYLLHVSDSDKDQTVTWSANAPSHGTLSFSDATALSGGTSIIPEASMTYTPSPGYAGADTIAIRVHDPADSVYRTISVDIVNTAPIFPDRFSTKTMNKNAPPTAIKEMLYAWDPDVGQSLTWSQHTAPGHGTLQFSGATASSGGNITSGGTITYTPDPGFVGDDSFVVQVNDGFETVTRPTWVSVEDPLLTVYQGRYDIGAYMNQMFGASVAVFGDTALVSGFGNAGGVLFFARNGATWTRQFVTADTHESFLGDHFGRSVTLFGDTAIVGAEVSTVNGVPFAGAAHVYVRNGDSWAEQARLIAGESSENFGFSVALYGDTPVVGAVHSEVGEVAGAGAAYVFVRKGTTWTQQAKLTAPYPIHGGRFGAGLALHGDTVVVGASTEALGMDGAGAAYVFVRNGSAWSQQAKLVASDPLAWAGFGSLGTIGLIRDTAVIGGGNTHGAYIFERNGTTWSQPTKLTVSNTEASSAGSSVAIFGDWLVLGDVSASSEGIPGGVAYVFARTGNTWTKRQRLTAPGQGIFDVFGASVALSENTLVVGAPSATVGAARAGAAHIFTVPDTVLTFAGGSRPLQVHVNDPATDIRDWLHVSDTDFSQTLTWTQSKPPRHGTLTFSGASALSHGTDIAPGGTITYTPNAGYFGSDTFTVRVSDGVDETTRTLSVQVNVDQLFDRPKGRLIASDRETGDFFGAAVAVSGDTALVGAQWESDKAGAAYVYVRNGDTWVEQAKLTPRNAGPGNEYGFAVALSGDTALVGGQSTGGATVFVRNGTAWSEQAKLTVGGAPANMGSALALNGNTAVVGASGASPFGINGAGAAVVFVRNGTTWTPTALLTAGDPGQNAHFGSGLALDGDTLVVGARGDVPGTGNGGGAYVFTGHGSDWTLHEKLAARHKTFGDLFGQSVALDGTTAIVGARGGGVGDTSKAGAAYVFNLVFDRPNELPTFISQVTSLTVGVNDPPIDISYLLHVHDTDNGQTLSWTEDVAPAHGTLGFAGATAASGNKDITPGGTIAYTPKPGYFGSDYVTVRVTDGIDISEGQVGINIAAERAILSASDQEPNDNFGWSVALSGETVLAGAWRESAEKGAAYVFVRSGATWSQQAKIWANDPMGFSNFGLAGGVSLYRNTALIGSFKESAYLFVRSGTSWSQQERLTASNPYPDTVFGNSVALQGMIAVVGERDANFKAGAVYVFALTTPNLQPAFVGSETILNIGVNAAAATGLNDRLRADDRDSFQTLTWTQGAAPSHGALNISGATALSGGTAITPGGTFTYTPTPGQFGPDSFTVQISDGVASVSRTISVIITAEQAILTASDQEIGDSLGWSVAVSGDTALAGAPGETAAKGAAYVYVRKASGWIEQAKLTGYEGVAGNRFGEAVALYGDTALVGAREANLANVGPNPVTLTVTDVHGNSASATAIVTIVDAVPPVVVTKNITVPLDASGNATITVAQIDNGSNDACGIASRSLSKTSFTCADLGPNTVTLTVTDVNGQSASTAAVVTVIDVTKPSLALNGPAEIILLQGNTYTELGATAVDQCDTTVPVVIGGDPVNTAAIGVYVVTYDAADDSGNAAPRVTRTVRVLPPFSIGNQLVGFKEVDLDEASKLTGNILSQEKLTHGVRSVVTGFARNVTGPAELREASQVNGNLETGGSVTLNESAAVGANVTSGGNVELKNKAKVVGNVTASGKVSVHRGATVGGTVTEKAPKPVFPNVLLPDLGLVSARPDIEVPKDGQLSLPPGTYGKLDLKQGATLSLAAGSYNFEQIDAASKAIFKLDVRQGALIVNVLGNVSAGQEVKFVPQAAPGDAAALKVLLQTEGTRVGLDRKTEFIGIILAPEAVIDVGQQVTVAGALYGKRVQVSANSTVTGAPAVSLLNGAALSWLGYKNDCDGSATVPAGTPDPLARLIGQAVYGCQLVDLGTSVVIAGNVAAQQGIQLSASSRVTGNLQAVSGNADLGTSVEVTGSVEAGGRVSLSAQAKVSANVVSRGDVDLGAKAAVTGNVTAAGKLQINKTATVGGTVTQNAVVPPIPAFFLPRLGLHALGEMVEVPKDGELSLPPGVYGEVSLRQNATLRLSAGTYRFDALDIGPKGHLELDLSGGSLVVNVVDTLDMDERTQMKAVAPAGASATGRILFQVQGSRVKLGQNGVFLGTFMAPNADVELRQDSKLQGALFGQSIRLGPKAEAQIEAAIDLMLIAALNWQVPTPTQAGKQGLDSSGSENDRKISKQSPPPKLIQLRAPIMEISATREGLPVLRITGHAGFKGELQARDRLIGGQWETLAELDTNTGIVEFTDESAAKAPVRFYRIITVEPPPAKSGNSANEQR